MTTTRLLGAGALALALAACGQQHAQDFAGATPDAAGLSLELAGGAPEGLTASVAPASAVAGPQALVAAPAAADELGEARAALRALNGEVARVLDQVQAAVQAGGVPLAGEAQAYGPAVRCVQHDASGACTAQASLLLTVKHHYGAVFSWVLAARDAASTSEADFRPVLAGWMQRGVLPHRGRGRAAFNLENLRLAAPAYTGRGYLLAGFAHDGLAESLAYRLVGFTPDAAAHAPVTAGFVGHRTPAGLTRVRVVRFADVVAGGNTAFPDEVELAHLGWQAGLGGRGYLVVSNWFDASATLHGDVPYTAVGTDHYYFGRGCWGPLGALRVKEWRYCARGLGPAACLLTAPIAVEPSGAAWATDCTGFAAEEPLPGDVSPGAEQGTQAEPVVTGDLPPADEPTPASATDTAPPATM
jgi:hypothetical protein